MDLLRGFHIRGATVIIATHDQDLVRNTKGRVVYLKDGMLRSAPAGDM